MGGGHSRTGAFLSVSGWQVCPETKPWKHSKSWAAVKVAHCFSNFADRALWDKQMDSFTLMPIGRDKDEASKS